MRISPRLRKTQKKKKPYYVQEHKTSARSKIVRKRPQFLLVAIIVIVLLGLLLSYKSDPRDVNLTDFDRTNIACRELLFMGIALTNFNAHMGRYPYTDEGLKVLISGDGIEGWKGPYLEVPRSNPWQDPWKRRYRYNCDDGTNVSLATLGADGKAGTDDDRIAPHFHVSADDRIKAALQRYKQQVDTGRGISVNIE